MQISLHCMKPPLYREGQITTYHISQLFCYSKAMLCQQIFNDWISKRNTSDVQHFTCPWCKCCDSDKFPATTYNWIQSWEKMWIAYNYSAFLPYGCNRWLCKGVGPGGWPWILYMIPLPVLHSTVSFLRSPVTVHRTVLLCQALLPWGVWLEACWACIESPETVSQIKAFFL